MTNEQDIEEEFRVRDKDRILATLFVRKEGGSQYVLIHVERDIVLERAPQTEEGLHKLHHIGELWINEYARGYREGKHD